MRNSIKKVKVSVPRVSAIFLGLSGVLGSLCVSAEELVCNPILPADATHVEIKALRKQDVPTGQFKDVANPNYNPSLGFDSFESPLKRIPVLENAWVLSVGYVSRSSARTELDPFTDRDIVVTSFEKSCPLSPEVSQRIVEAYVAEKSLNPKKAAKLKTIPGKSLAEFLAITTETRSHVYVQKIRSSELCYVHPSDLEENRTSWKNWQEDCLAKYDSKNPPTRELNLTNVFVRVKLK